MVPTVRMNLLACIFGLSIVKMEEERKYLADYTV
jgi:hypothetical protein